MSVLFLMEYLYPELVIGYRSIGQRFVDVYISFVVCSTVIFAVITLILDSHGREQRRIDEVNSILKEKVEILNRTNLDLEEALSKVKTLSGLLPICACCKNIRDDKGYWNQIEGYITEHSEAEFSHGICPPCMRKLYPEEYAELASMTDKP